MAKVTFSSLKRGSTYAAISELWHIGSRFILTPLIIAKLGLEGYGVWALIFSICSYISMFNVSAGMAYVKFTAEHDANGTYRELSALISSGVLSVGGIALLVCTAIWFARIPVFNLINVPVDLQSDAETALFLVGLTLLIQMSFGCVLGILAGLQRTDLRYKLMILSSTISFSIALILLSREYGLIALAVGHLCGGVASTIFGWVLVARICPEIRLSPMLISRPALKSIFSLAIKFQFLGLLIRMLRSGLYIAISAICGVSMLAIFDMSRKLISLARTFCGAVIAPLMPAFANLVNSEDKAGWLKLYSLSSKIVLFIAIVSFSGLVVFADKILLIWTGQEFPLAAWSIRVLVFGQFFAILTGIGTASLRGLGQIRLETQYSVVTAVLTFALIFPANYLGGYKFVVLSVFLGTITGALYFLVGFHKKMGVSIFEYFQDSFKGIAIGVTFIGIGLYVRPIIEPLIPSLPDRLSAIFDVTIAGGVFVTLIALILYYGYLPISAKRYILKSVFSKARS